MPSRTRRRVIFLRGGVDVVSTPFASNVIVDPSFVDQERHPKLGRKPADRANEGPVLLNATATTPRADSGWQAARREDGRPGAAAVIGGRQVAGRFARRLRRMEERVVLLAALKPGARERALELLEKGTENDHESVTERQSVFLSDRDVIFLFEGEDARASVRELLNDPVRSTFLTSWLPLFDGPLHSAFEAFFFERGRN
jgi:hypothetical protein